MTYYIIATIASFVLTFVISMIVSRKNSNGYVPVSDRYISRFSSTKPESVEEIDPADMDPINW